MKQVAVTNNSLMCERGVTAVEVLPIVTPMDIALDKSLNGSCLCDTSSRDDIDLSYSILR
jgi:hypothetical protein